MNKILLGTTAVLFLSLSLQAGTYRLDCSNNDKTLTYRAVDKNTGTLVAFGKKYKNATIFSSALAKEGNLEVENGKLYGNADNLKILANYILNEETGEYQKVFAQEFSLSLSKKRGQRNHRYFDQFLICEESELESLDN